MSLNPTDAPSFQAAQRMSEAFKSPDAGGAVMIVLEGQQPLGEDAHRYYDHLIRELRDDHEACAAHSGFLG